MSCYLQPQGKTWQHHWMHQLGQLLYIVERNRKISAAVAAQPRRRTQLSTQNSSQNARLLQRVSPALPKPAQAAPRDPNVDIITQRPVLRAAAQSTSRGFPPPYPSRYSPQGSRVGPEGSQKQAVGKGANALQRVCASSNSTSKLVASLRVVFDNFCHSDVVHAPMPNAYKISCMFEIHLLSCHFQLLTWSHIAVSCSKM